MARSYSHYPKGSRPARGGHVVDLTRRGFDHVHNEKALVRQRQLPRVYFDADIARRLRLPVAALATSRQWSVEESMRRGQTSARGPIVRPLTVQQQQHPSQVLGGGPTCYPAVPRAQLKQSLTT